MSRALRSRLPVGGAALLLVSLGLTTACSGQSTPVAQVRTASSTPSPAATPTPTPSPVATTSPYSGRPGGVGTPVVVVKLDNTPSAQPHVGLTKADVVYVEPVEWGLTRLAAVFSTTLPETVGPVRSARVSDIEVFGAYGDVAFVYSGAQRRLQPKITAAKWSPVSEDLDSPGFERDWSRPSPYNLMAHPREIVATSGTTATSRDMGLVFDQAAPLGGKPATTVTARWEGASMQFLWNEKKGVYDVWIDGRQARDTQKPGVQRASSVIVQYVKETDSGYGDKFGGRTPRSHTVGSGKALLLRDGRSYRISWSRTRATDPTAYRDASGRPIALSPGQVWIVLKDRTQKVVVE
jgi:hypothetical protein